MSVPMPQRGHGELEVNTKARALTVYTLRILENEKWFPQKQRRYIEKLQDCAIEIQALCWEANEIKVNGDPERYKRRIALQDMAAEKCNRMTMLIETAQPLFHLTTKRTIHWINQSVALRNLIRGWREKDVIRLKPQGE